MTANEIRNLLENQKLEQLREQETKKQESNLLNNIQTMLNKDIRNQETAVNNRNDYNRDVMQKDIQEIKNLANENIKAQNNVKPASETQTILNNAIKETEQMVKLSSEAKNLNNQIYSKRTDDVAQLSKLETTPNTKTNTVAEQVAAVSFAIGEEEKTKTIRVSEEVGIKNQMSNSNKEKDQVEINNQTIKRPVTDNKLDLSMEMNYSNSNQESKGKEIIEEKRKEQIEEKKSQVHTPEPHPTEITEEHHEFHKMNKLRAKFKGHHLHF